jgi:hypothetical protein
LVDVLLWLLGGDGPACPGPGPVGLVLGPVGEYEKYVPSRAPGSAVDGDVGDEDLDSLDGLETSLDPATEVSIIPAIAGGLNTPQS